MDIRIKSFEEYKAAYEHSVSKPEKFWGDMAQEFIWKKPFDQVLDWEFESPSVKWFQGGQLNITENALDRWVSEDPNRVAFYWEPNDPKENAREISYKELHQEVCKAANVLKAQGIEKGDVVCIYMPMIPELVISVLACARIGAIHSVVFAGFSAKSLADRIQDASAKMLITTDAAKRGAKNIDLHAIWSEALRSCPSLESVLVKAWVNKDYQPGQKEWLWDELVSKQDVDCPAEVMNSEDELFILYTSGSTGKPKGVVHTCAGYMLYTAFSFQNVFQYQAGQVYWCTADVGWITGHSYIIYGPLLSGATSVMFEGVPSYPDAGRFWQVCDKYQVNAFYTAPTAIRSLMACGDDFVNHADLSSLKVLGTVGEPINEEAWHWYHQVVGKEKCAVVDTWWQTETGGIMISGLGDLSPSKPSYAGLPLPGIQPVILDKDGMEVTEAHVEGLLAIKFPWPSMLRTTWGDHERCRQVYFSAFKNHYFTGDGAKKDEQGLIRIIGRVDDVINVSGHRFGTAEIENAINAHPKVVESAVVGYPHDIKGQGIYAFVIGESGLGEEQKAEILSVVNKEIGPIAKPDKIQFVSGLPKTRSGKIMRRILRKIADGTAHELGDVSTLLDPEVVAEIRDNAL